MTGRIAAFLRRLWIDFRQLSRYDFLLASIPLLFALGLVGSQALAIPLRTGIVIGAALGLVALFDALFREPPIERRGRGT